MLQRLIQLVDTIPTHMRSGRVMRGPAARTRSDIRFVQLDRAMVRCRQLGHGRSLVFATDPPVPLECYDALFDALAPRFRVTVFEMPGFGASLPRAGMRLSMREAISLVAQGLERFGGEPHTLIMPCVLGLIGVGVARHHEGLIRRLVLSQAADWNGTQQWLARRDPKGMLRKPIVGQLALAALRRKRIDAWYRTALADPDLVRPLVDMTLENFDQGGCFCLASGFQDCLGDHQHQLAPIAQDTLLVWGDADPSHRGTHFGDMSTLAPNSELVCIPGAGHFPELERGPAFVDHLLRFTY